MRAVFLSILLCCSTAVSAFPSDKELAAQPRWQALLHINPGATLRDRHRSYVDDEQFFLSESGKDDALAELVASRDALSQSGAEARCRFPARYRFLSEQLGWQDSAPFSHCSGYLEWRQAVTAKRAVLVFPAAYLNSPSSMFGHTLLRLDQGEDSAVWLSWAVNFGAVAMADDNSFFYIYRGLAGGYPGRFALVPYVQKIQEYSHMENRDMWEYRLNLSAVEIDRLLRHVWELRDINFDYFFFDENCSYRLLELLEVARPGVDLTSSFAYAAMPVDTVRAVAEAAMVDGISYRPSKRLELDALMAQLPVEQHDLVRRLAEGKLQSLDALDIADEQSAQIYLAAYRYLRYQQSRQQRRADIAARSLTLLRGAQRGGASRLPAVDRPGRPDDGHRTSLLAISLGHRELGGGHAGGSKGLEYADLNWRISYHDAMDPVLGYPLGASLVMGDVKLRWQDREGLRLQGFDLLNIRSLSPRGALFSPLSWQVQLGLERLDDAPSQPLVAQLSAAAGPSWSLLGGIGYVMPALRSEYNPDFRQDWRVAPGLRSGLLWQGERLALETSAELLDFSGAGQRKQYRLAANYQWSTDRGMRLAIDHRDQPWGRSTGVELAWRHYF